MNDENVVDMQNKLSTLLESMGISVVDISDYDSLKIMVEQSNATTDLKTTCLWIIKKLKWYNS